MFERTKLKRSVEKIVTSLILVGFLVFAVGVILLVIYHSIRSSVPLEATMVLVGLTLLVLGVIAAKIFGGSVLDI